MSKSDPVERIMTEIFISCFDIYLKRHVGNMGDDVGKEPLCDFAYPKRNVTMYTCTGLPRGVG